jgi:hypothetical protein
MAAAALNLVKPDGPGRRNSTGQHHEQDHFHLGSLSGDGD